MRKVVSYMSVAILPVIGLFVALWFYENRLQNNYSDHMQIAHQNLNVGMNFAQVSSIIRLKPSAVNFESKDEATQINVVWSSRDQDGMLHNFLSYKRLKGQYDLFLTFDQTGILRKIEGGFN